MVGWNANVAQSNGSANPSSEMIYFQECVNNNEIVDLHSVGFYHTWTKSLKNLKCRTLKKLDRVMVNEAFMDIFQDAYGVFLPYMNSDHFPIIVKIPNGVQKKKGSFRFSNFITDKEEFLTTDSKAPRPDGYTLRFYKSAWSIVGKEVSQAIREFFLTGKLLSEAYDTISWDINGFPERMVLCIMNCVTSTKFSISINGGRVGYFKGGRGLRHGDPISPYLFTLVMEVFNLTVRKNIKENGNFKYHYGCKKLEITHLCFADDLLVFYHEDCESVSIIKKSLNEFSRYSGLRPNMQKSTMFFGGLSNAEQNYILQIIPFTVGKLAVRIIGQSVFLLTKQVIYEINKLLKGFLWCHGKLTKGKAKVSCDAICKPKDQDRLGLKNLSIWNEVLMIKHLRNIAAKKDTIWVKWISVESGIWNDLNKMLNVRLSGWWDQIIDEIKALPTNNNIWSIVRRLVCNATVYYIWHEKNYRMFKNEIRDSNTILQMVKEIVGIRDEGEGIQYC
nr:hypothetical protein [Tanacetum cinerariifolium]